MCYNFLQGLERDDIMRNLIGFFVILTVALLGFAVYEARADVTIYIPDIGVGGRFSHALIIRCDGSLWAWGSNDAGQLGDGTTISQNRPVHIMDSVAMVTGGISHSVALKTDGSLWAWGSNNHGQLGDGTTESRLAPVKIMDSVVYISAFYRQTFAIQDDGSLWAWGRNDEGQLGDGTRVDRHVPVKTMDSILSVSAGSHHGMAIKTDGSLWRWGVVGRPRVLSPTPIKIMDSAAYVQSGIFTSVIIDADGNFYLIDALNSRGEIASPVKMLDSVVAYAAERGASGSFFAIQDDGSLWAWGNNMSGQLGHGITTSNQQEPVKIMDSVASVAVAEEHTAAIMSDGSLWAWGSNLFGQLGNGNVSVGHDSIKVMCSVVSVAANAHKTIAVRADGSVWAWGRHGSSEEPTYYVPVKILGRIFPDGEADLLPPPVHTEVALELKVLDMLRGRWVDERYYTEPVIDGSVVFPFCFQAWHLGVNVLTHGIAPSFGPDGGGSFHGALFLPLKARQLDDGLVELTFDTERSVIDIGDGPGGRYLPWSERDIAIYSGHRIIVDMNQSVIEEVRYYTRDTAFTMVRFDWEIDPSRYYVGAVEDGIRLLWHVRPWSLDFSTHLGIYRSEVKGERGILVSDDDLSIWHFEFIDTSAESGKVYYYSIWRYQNIDTAIPVLIGNAEQIRVDVDALKKQ